jgi:hypothetical protein
MLEAKNDSKAITPLTVSSTVTSTVMRSLTPWKHSFLFFYTYPLRGFKFSSQISMKNFIALVGASRLSSSDEPVASAKIQQVLSQYQPSTTSVVSGGQVGIDKLSARIARSMGFEVVEHFAKAQCWEEYKKRNILIANQATKVFVFVLPLRAGGKGSCYHCGHVGKNNNHQVSGGCWTGKFNGAYDTVVIT